MSVIAPLTGELSDSKVAAIFDNEATARRTVARLREELSLGPAQAQVVGPDDRHPGRKLLPESHGIFRTILVAHYKLCVAGLAIGAVVFAALYAMGIAMIVSSPVLAAALIIGYGGVFGLMFGGLVSLRPDQDPYLLKVREALQEGRYAVVVHAFDPEQRDRAEQSLAAHGGDTIRTL
jgi:hypothetical protein